MQTKFLQNIYLLLFTFFLWSCDDTSKRFRALEEELSKAEAQQIDDFSVDSLFQRTVSNSQILKKEIEVLLAEIKADQIELPYYQLDNRLSTYLKQIEKIQTDASIYNLGGHLKRTLSTDNKALENKLITCDSLLNLAPDYYLGAQRKLQDPFPESLSLAIRKQTLGIYFLNNDFQDHLKEKKWSPQEEQVWEQKIIRAQRSMKDYIAWCNSQLIDYHAIENSISQ